MQLSYEVLNILLFLCPGLLASWVLRLLVYRKESSAFDKVVGALLGSLVIYALCAGFGHDAAVQMTETKHGDVVTRGITYNASAIAWLFGVATALPLLMVYALNQDWLGRALRKIRITSQSARATIWLDVFAEYRRYVVVHLADERRVFGWIMHYSNTAEDGFIYLHGPKWLDAKNQYIETNSHGLFLVKRDLIDFIEFLQSPEETKPVPGPEPEIRHEQSQA